MVAMFGTSKRSRPLTILGLPDESIELAPAEYADERPDIEPPRVVALAPEQSRTDADAGLRRGRGSRHRLQLPVEHVF